MKIDVLGLGSTLLGAKFNGLISIGVNDVFKFRPVDYLVLIDKPQAFAPDRLATIKSSTSARVITHIAEWSHYFDNVELIKLAHVRSETAYLKSDMYPYSICSPYVAVIHAYKLGASEIVMHGVDLVNHPKLSEELKLRRIRIDFHNLYVALKREGVSLSIGSKESALYNIIPLA